MQIYSHGFIKENQETATFKTSLPYEWLRITLHFFPFIFLQKYDDEEGEGEEEDEGGKKKKDEGSKKRGEETEEDGDEGGKEGEEGGKEGGKLGQDGEGGKAGEGGQEGERGGKEEGLEEVGKVSKKI